MVIGALVAGPSQAQVPATNDPYQGVPAPRMPPRSVNPPPRPQPTPATAAPVTSVPMAPSPRFEYPVAVGQSFRDCEDCPEMVVVPAGGFTMGSPPGEEGRAHDEGPQRHVTLREPLAIGKYHVTVGEYRAFVHATRRADGGTCFVFGDIGSMEDQQRRSWRNLGFKQTERDPVVCVSREDARAYAAWISERSRQRYRLPTEAEWEYAARAGAASRWWWGDDVAGQCKAANGRDQRLKREVPGMDHQPNAPCDDGYAFIAPVGRFAANRFGLHDMGGNVSQWVLDCYRDTYMGAPPDASTPVEGTPCQARLVRGGAWWFGPKDLRAATRIGVTPERRGSDAGFRLVRTPKS